MSHLSFTVRVDAPPDVVFDVLADPARAPEWQTLMTELGDVAGRPGGVGTSFVGYYRVAGRRLETRFVITAAERPTLIQLAGTTRGGWARWTTLIESVDRGGSELRASLEYELPGEVVSGLFGLVTGSRIRLELERTYENLRRVVEADARAVVDPALSG